MIPSKADITIKSTMQGEDIQMGIDPAALIHLQNILTDLYSDPELAIIREYSTNARDSHLEAGHNKAIEVTTPTSLDPSLHIRDFGVGLSLEDIRQVYSLYGASTKRASANQNGMLGVGCKSALTYTNSFTIRSVKDGILTIVMVTRDESGAGSMKVLRTDSTIEPNGVEIVIPAKAGNKLLKKAETFFSHWEKSPIPVLLNGHAPKKIDGAWITDNIVLTHESGHYDGRKVLVHMAGVSYKADDGFSFDRTNLGYNTNVTFFVEDGSVDFTPSREELHYTAKTKNTLNKLADELRNGIQLAMQKEIDAQPDHSTAIAAYKRWSKYFYGNTPFSYKGSTLQGNLETTEEYTINSWGHNNYRELSRGVPVLSLVLNDTETNVIVEGKTDKKLPSHRRAKLRTWAAQNSLGSQVTFYFVEKDNWLPWTAHLKHVDWETIINVKPAPNPNAKYTEPEHYVFVRNQSRQSIDPATEVDTTKPIGYAYLSEVKQNDEGLIGIIAGQADINIYGVPKAKLKEFQKLYPQAKHFKDLLQERVTEELDSFTLEELDLIKNFNSIRDLHPVFSNLIKLGSRIDLIEDVELKDAIKLRSGQGEIHHKNEKVFERLNNWKRLIENAEALGLIQHDSSWDTLESGNEKYARMIDRYPLAEFHSYRMNSVTIQNHLLIYINAAYQEENNTQCNTP